MDWQAHRKALKVTGLAAVWIICASNLHKFIKWLDTVGVDPEYALVAFLLGMAYAGTYYFVHKMKG